MFKDVQYDVPDNDRLLLYLRYHSRISSIITIGTGLVIILNILYTNLAYVFLGSLIGQLLAQTVSLYGLYCGHNKMNQLLLNETHQDHFAYVFIGSTLVLCSVITYSLIYPIIGNIVNQSQLIFTILSFIQTISLIFQMFTYFQFCQNSNTYQIHIYLYSMIVGLVSLRIYGLRYDLAILHQMNLINEQNLEIVIFITILILTSMIIDTLNTFYRPLKNPLIKYIFAMLFVTLSFSIVGLDGHLLRQLDFYVDQYKSNCRVFMNYAHEDLFNVHSCKKYNNQLLNPLMTTEHWEKDHQMMTINEDCCQYLVQVLLEDYISVTIYTVILAVSMVSLSAMMLQVRMIEENAISQSFKQLCLVIMIAAFIMAQCNFSNTNQIRVDYDVQEIGFLQQSSNSGCQHVVQESVIARTNGTIFLTLSDGQFVYEEVSQLYVEQFTNQSTDNIYMRGEPELLKQSLRSNLQMCLFSVSSSLTVNTNKHLELIDKYLQFVDIDIHGSGRIQLFNSYLIDCIPHQRPYMELELPVTLYNYPRGQYGTILSDQSCTSFQAQEMIVNLITPSQDRLVISLQWTGDADLDLNVQYKDCIVGPKYRYWCASMGHHGDVLKGTQGQDPSEGELIAIQTLSEGVYTIFVDGGRQLNAIVQVHQNGILLHSVSSIQALGTGSRWLVFRIDKQFLIVNQYS